MRTRALVRSALLLLVPTAAVLTACTGSDSGPSKLTAAQQLAAAKVKVDAATSMHLTVRSSNLPASVNGVLGADGTGTHAPAFKGTLSARISGFEAKVDVVAINKLLYVKLPFTTQFVQADPKKYNAPDPAQLFAKQGGVTSLLTATTNPVTGPKTRAGSDVVQTITGTLPGAAVKKLLNVGDPTKPFKVTYGITEPGGELRTVTMTGPFYGSTSSAPKQPPPLPNQRPSAPAASPSAASTAATSTAATSTYTLILDKYGAPVEIRKP
jgi:lipoprotein LprG